jgi:hypothetical protein
MRDERLSPVPAIIFVLSLGGIFLGTQLRRTLREHHLDEHAKDVVRSRQSPRWCWASSSRPQRLRSTRKALTSSCTTRFVQVLPIGFAVRERRGDLLQ